MFDALFEAIAETLAFFYSLVHSFGGAIILLTLAVMAVTFPLNVRGTKQMTLMSRLAPEAKAIQAKHKNDRQKATEETMALYAQYGVTPMGGCLWTLLPWPVFIVLYQVIYGLTRKVDGVPKPKHISPTSELYQAIEAAQGRMEWLGTIDLAETARDVGFPDGWAYFILIAAVAATSYWQQRMVTSRNPQATQDNPMAQQMQMMGKVMPLIFAVVSLSIQAGAVLYILVSNLFRIGQQWLLFRFDPVLANPGTLPAAKPGRRSRFLDVASQAAANRDARDGRDDRGAGESDGPPAKPAAPAHPPAQPRPSGRVTPAAGGGARQQPKSRGGKKKKKRR